MKRVGLIDNLSNIDDFRAERFHEASAADVMIATGGNTGNIAFVHGVRRLVKNPILRVGWGWSPEVVRSKVDHLIVCCANQLGAHADLGTWADRLDAFELPVTLIGLGAQAESTDRFPSIPPGSVRFLEAAKRLAWSGETNIATRGEFTSAMLTSMGVASEPIGCPSLMISPVKNLGDLILEKQRHSGVKKVAVAAGNPWHGRSAPLEPTLVDIVDSYDGDYVLQHPESMLQFAYGEVGNISEQTFARFTSVYGERFNANELLEWYRRKSAVFVDIQAWMRYLKRVDLAIGPRYHGIALAIQAGVPGCVVTIDSRTAELCEGTAVKAISLDEALRKSAGDLVSAALWTVEDASKLDSTRMNRAIAYASFIRSNDLEPSAHLLQLSS